VRVLLVQPSLDPPGGGHLVAAWMLEALRGPPEIVGDEPRLAFRDPTEAAERVLAAHRDPALQAELRATLAPRAERCSSARFVDELRSIVAAR
jgi:hypothetical protein